MPTPPLAQSRRGALVLDIRGNAGGCVSELVLEKISQRVLGYERYAQHSTADSRQPTADRHSAPPPPRGERGAFLSLRDHQMNNSPHIAISI